VLSTWTGVFADDPPAQKQFPSAKEAVAAFVAAVRAHDKQELLAIFGPESQELISSADPVSDRQRMEKFIAAYDQRNDLSGEEDQMVLVVGEQDWPFPIPLIKQGEQWVFDTSAGKEEVLNRRVGQNELNTIQTMLAIVDAQREYAMQDRDDDGILEYAQKFRSDPGKKNGLYWPTAEGEELSPLGALVAQAMAEGYVPAGTGEAPVPIHGYYYRLLAKQGDHAPGGAFDYVVNGVQIGGFAVVAYPAEYGNSGVMTFMVNHDGVVYEQDLGPDTATKAQALTEFNPDPQLAVAVPSE
jgi:hypothetical protein